MADENIVIGIKGEVEGGKVVARTLDDIDKAQLRAKSHNKELENQFKQTNSAATYLGTALKGLLAAFGLREMGQILDTYTNIQNRLKLVTANSAELTAVTKELFAISNDTRVSFESTATIYTRTAAATKELGLTQSQTLQFTKSLNQAVVLSGASAAEASAGLIQLSQGLASGTLRGDELRSVLEQLPAVADVIAKSLGVTRGELRKMGEDGKITAGTIIKAFAEAQKELDTKFAKTVPTIGQSFTLLKNRVIELTGELDKTSGASEKVAFVIIKSADVISMFVHEITAAFQLLNGIFTDIVGGMIVIIDTALLGIQKVINGGIKAVNVFRDDKISEVSLSSGLSNKEITSSTIELSNQSYKNAGASAVKAGNDFGAIFGLNEPASESLKKTNEQLNITEKAVAGVDDGMKRLIRQTDQFASSAASAFGDFISGAKTGKEALFDLVGSLQNLLLQETITNPLSDMLRGAFKGGGSGGGGIGSALSSGLGSVFGSIGNGIKGLFGFDSGGSMVLGGNGGIDQNTLALNGAPIAKVGRGEVLSISPTQSGGGGGITINQSFNLSMGVAAAVAAEFNAYMPKIQEQTRRAVAESQARGIR